MEPGTFRMQAASRNPMKMFRRLRPHIRRTSCGRSSNVSRTFCMQSGRNGPARRLRGVLLAVMLLPAIGAAALGGQVTPHRTGCAKVLKDKAFSGCRYNGGEPIMAQISPAIRRARATYLFDSEREKRDSVLRRKRRPDLVDALLEPPGLATIPVLREHNIPIIPDVPPIVILQPRGDERDRRSVVGP